MRLAEHAEQAALRVLRDELTNLILRQVTRFRDTWDLEQRRSRSDVRIKAACRSRREIHRHRCARIVGGQLTGCSFTRSISDLAVGPLFDPPEFAALYGAGIVFVLSLGSMSVVAEGRPWKYAGPVKFCPISDEPITRPSRSIRLPLA